MRFSRSESAVLGSSKDKILKSSRSKKKHKRLDAICEKVYTRNHNGVERMELNEGDVGGNENERRKSTRIRRAPQVLDASPMPPKKRRRIDKTGRLSRRDKGKRVVKLKSENLCSTSKDSEEGEENLVGWRSRLRTRRKFARFGGRKKESFSPKGRTKIFEDFDEVNEETASRIQESDKEEEVIGGRSSAGKSKREGEEVAFGIQESDEEEEVIGGRSSAGKSTREGEEMAFGIQESDEEEEVIGGRSSAGKSKREGEEVAFGIQESDEEEEVIGGWSSAGKSRREGKEVAFGIQESDKEEEFIGRRSSAEKSKRLGRSFVRFGGRKKENFSPKGRRKIFEDFDEVNEETTSRIQESDKESDKEEEVIGGRSSVGKSKREGEEVAFKIQESDKEEEFIGGRSSAAKSKRLGRVKVLRGLENEDEEIDFAGSVGEDKEVEVEVALGSSDEGNGFLLKSGVECASVDESKGGLGSSNLVEKEKTDIEGRQYLEDHHSNGDAEMEHHSNDDAEMEHHSIDDAEMEHCSNDDAEMQLCKQTCNVVVHQIGAVEIYGDTEGQPKVGEFNDKHTEAKTSEKLNKTKHALDGTQRPMRIKEGRRCGLCGGATDGKPPKKLAQDGYGSYDDACSGGSASEEPNYDVWDGFGDEPSWLGRLLGPVNDRFGIAGIWVHQQCAVWSPEVYFAGLGCLKNVRAALYRGRALKCSRCGRPGATIGCRVDRCPKTYHLPCARDSGCIFDHRKFLIACTDHRHIFQPHGSQYLHKLKKMKVKKMKMEIRKVSNDALRKDFEAEEKWMEHCGEDEEFLKRESKRLHRDLLRIAPTYIGASSCNTEMQFQGWESVAGLQDVIQCMKEVVILPLLYPEFFSSLGLTPPRGVLLHGYPGTGKTLVVRALIGSCARGDRRIAYFARKGADCLGKYVGDAERQLRLLFQVAEKSQPSIIFFDEIDGLAPSRTRQQDQTHSSVVSTLLALMDGLKSRGSVVVIGATNRPDAIDPALRRPGRFDREIYFPLPSVKDREAILSLHTQKWPKQISGSLLKWVSRRTVGFAGADLQALCTQAAIIALRRNFPLQELLAGTGENALLSKRPPLPSFTVEERDWLDALLLAPPPCSQREAGIAANDVTSSPLAGHLVPCLLRPLSKLLVSLYLDERVWLPPPLHKAVTLIKNVIVSALVRKKALGDKWWSHLHDLLQEADILNEIEDKLSRVTILTDAFGSFDQLEDVADDRYLKFKPSRVQRIGAHPGLLHTISGESGFKSGFRILISGEARCGQRHLSSCLLHCFSGDIEIRKLDLATLSQEGHGDVVQGLTLILMRCASVGSCMLFLPRIDLWAVETCNEPCEGETTSPSSNSSAIEELAKNSESQNAVKNATYLWNSFIEQAESICVRTPLTILATSEIPFADLPSRVKQFFRCDIVDCGLSTPSKDTVPRFVVEIDGNLKPDSVIGTTAAKLSVDLVQYFIYLVHHSIHSKSSSEESRNIAELSADAINSSSDPGSITEGESKHLIAPGTTVTVHNSVKGKSSLLAAISTFGYQILRYPHFAELCWVTSKLKQGPCTPINGPWKGWPFNSCIVRPLNSMEGITVPSNSSTTKNKDKSCVVRGLIAVGLSAYRGEYASLRAFSCEIRKVLELLVGRVDTKIQAGKDRYKFFRLLSQVAYFDDMVMSWAYTLRSLEVDAHISEGCPRLISSGSLTNHSTSKDCLPERGGYKENISSETLHESEVLEQTPQEVNAKHVGHHPVADDDLKFQNRGDEIGAAHEEASVPSVLDHYASGVQIQSPLPNGISSEACIPMDVEDHTEVDGDLEGSKCCNGFVMRDSVVLEGGPHVFGDKCGMELSDSQKICNSDSAVPSAVNGIPLDNGVENSSVCSLRIPANSYVSGLVCMYHCCSHCLVNLYQLLLKLLNYEQKLKGSSVTVEDFHDFVVSLSISLQSAVRNLFSKNSSSYGCDEKLMERKCQKYTQCTQRCVLQPKISGKPLVVPMECSCHSAGDGITTEGKFLQNTRQGFDTKFFFRDDVLVATLDNDCNNSFHCKFEKLCLCSLVECIVTSKDPLD